MGPILNFLSSRRLTSNERNWLNRKRNLQLGQAQWEWRNPRSPHQQPYDFSQRAGKTPLFGSSKGFGLDYVQTHSIPAVPQGVVREGVSAPIKQRRGSTVGLQPARIHEKSELQETTRRFPLGGTDQAPIQGRRSAGGSWDGIVRNRQKRPSYLTATRSKQETPADKITRSMKAEPYSFIG